MLRTRRPLRFLPAKRYVVVALLAALLGSFGLVTSTPLEAKRVPVGKIAQLLRNCGSWVTQTVASYTAGKAIDRAVGEDFKTQLEREMAPLLAEISTEIGGHRAALDEQLELIEEQHAVLLDLLDAQLLDQAALASLARRQRSIETRVGRLERRVDRLEDDVDDLRFRVEQLEDAYIAQCLDLRTAPRVGADGFHVDPAQIQQLTEVFESERLRISTRAFLDACTADLTQRGMLVQLAVITYGLDRQLELLATFKHLGASFDSIHMNHLARLEIPVYRPRHAVDGQVLEIFIPYDDIPFSSYGEPIAVAFVLTHDRQPVYSIPDQVIRCTVGRQLRCRWGR